MNISTLAMLFKTAKKEAQKSTYKHKLGAVIFNKRKIISSGYNKNKTHPKMQEHNIYCTIHAEMDAVISAKKNIRNSSIFVCRILKDESPALAKPCNDCQRILAQCGINKVYYTTNEFPFYDYMKLKEIK